MKGYVLIAALALAACTPTSTTDTNKTEMQQTCNKIRKALFIGDSITDGAWGHDCEGKPSKERSHGDLNHIYGHGYMYLCASELQSKYPERDIQFFNRGISGHTLKMMVDRWGEDCIDLQPDLVSILIGTNDVEYYVGRDTITEPFDFKAWDEMYRYALDTLQTACHNVQIVLCTPFVAPSGWRGEAPNFVLRQSLIDSLDVHTEQIAKDYGARLVRFDALFKELEKIQPRKDYWIWDGIHPTAAGHRRMADVWLESTKDLFEE